LIAFDLERLILVHRSKIAHCSIGQQRLLAAYLGDCLLSIGRRTDKRHDISVGLHAIDAGAEPL